MTTNEDYNTMNFDEYQHRARTTVQNHEQADARIVALLGIAGESGELLSEYKKHLRDGEAHKLFPERVREELGDLLWYIARTADLFSIPLASVAEENLRKTFGRWGEVAQLELLPPASYDEAFPSHEQLPRRMEVKLIEVERNGRRVTETYVNGQKRGDDLTDNAYTNDGYRFHDVFHFSYAACLGWSPVVRLILSCKRKSNPIVDEVEDGGRAKVIEEGVSALAFAYAREHNVLRNVSSIDRDVLRTIQKMVAHLEVASRTTGEWERAILQGFDVWHRILENKGGTFIADLDTRTITYVGEGS